MIKIPLKNPPKDILLTSGTILNHRNERLYWRSWQGDDTPSKGLVIIQHGYSEYGDRYHHVATYLVRHGYAAFSLDAHGHGRSDGERGYVESWDDYVDDLELGMDFAEKKFPNLPIFMIGHSNGGLMALRFALRHRDNRKVRAYAVASPFCGIKFKYDKILEKIIKFAEGVAPRVHLGSKLLAQKDTSHLKAVVRAYREDPLVFAHTTPKWALESIKAQKDLLRRAEEITAPFIFFVSGDDAIVEPKAAQKVYAKLGSKRKELHLLPGLYHENLNENGWENRVEQMIEWFDSNL